MKRYLTLLFCLSTFVLAQAQSYDYRGLKIQQERVKSKNVYEWENFALFNYSLGVLQQDETLFHTVGITYGRVKLFGWYANAMITGGHYSYSYHSSRNGKIDGVYPFYTGKRSLNRASITAGGIVRMVVPFYMYLGVGYGYQSITRELNSKKWAMVDYYSMGHSMVWDFGFQGNIKGYTFSIGYSVLTDYDEALHEVKIGLGYTFK